MRDEREKLMSSYGEDRGLEMKVLKEGPESLKRGKAVRRNVTLLCTLVLAALIACIEIFWVFDMLSLAIVIAVASLSICYAIMSMSASINAQMDMQTLALVHYVEKVLRKIEPEQSAH